MDLVENITAELLGTNNKITCAFDKQDVCESSPAPLFLAVGLPWRTELYLEGTEVRDHITSETPGGSIGWKMTCKEPSNFSLTDECTGTLASVGLANVGGGVERLFDAKSTPATCKTGIETGRAGAGLVSGTTLMENISSTEKLTFD